MTTAIETSQLTVDYGSVRALENASMTVAAGKVTGLIGMNGSGKSTLFKALTGMVQPTSGTILLDGQTPAQARRKGLLGYVPQSEDV